MTQFNPGSAPARRGGELTVYTALLAAATLTLVIGIVLLVQANIAQSGSAFGLAS